MQQIINNVGQLLKDRNNRTRKAYSRDKSGEITGDVDAPESCKFCLVGALRSAPMIISKRTVSADQPYERY